MKAKKVFTNRPEQPEAKSYGHYLDRDAPLSEKVARRVKELRTGEVSDVIHSWRRLAEIICEEFPEQALADGWESVEAAHGNQLYGIDLCRAAALSLGEDINQWEEDIEKALNSYRDWREKEKAKDRV